MKFLSLKDVKISVLKSEVFVLNVKLF